MKKAVQHAVTLALLLGLALASWAQPGSRVYRDGNVWVEETTGTLPPARNLRIDTQVGSVNVQGGASGITYVVRKRLVTASEARARREFEQFRVVGTRQGDTAVLRGEWIGGDSSHRMSAEFSIRSPRELEFVNVQTRGGGVTVNNIAGRLETETAGGSITLDNIGGAIRAATMGGGVTVGSAGGDAVLKSAGGSILVENIGGQLIATTYGGDIRAGVIRQLATLETMGGSIHVRQVGGDLRATTAGGNVEAGEVGGTALLKTAGGNIRLAAGRGLVDAATAGGGITLWKLERGAQAETAAGGITAEFVGGAFAASALQTTAGDITVFLGPKLACSVRAAIEMASGHKIRSDFPELKISAEGADFGPREWFAQGALNGGGPLLKLRTSIGDIDIRKASAPR